MTTRSKYLGPAWKFINNSGSNHLVDTKEKDILKEYCLLDEKYYIPLDDLFHLMRSPNKDVNIPNYIYAVDKYPNEYANYLSDLRKIDPYTTI